MAVARREGNSKEQKKVLSFIQNGGPSWIRTRSRYAPTASASFSSTARGDYPTERLRRRLLYQGLLSSRRVVAYSLGRSSRTVTPLTLRYSQVLLTLQLNRLMLENQGYQMAWTGVGAIV